MAYHRRVPSDPQTTIATHENFSLVNITPNATRDIGRSPIIRIAKGTLDGPFAIGREKLA